MALRALSCTRLVPGEQRAVAMRQTELLPLLQTVRGLLGNEDSRLRALAAIADAMSGP